MLKKLLGVALVLVAGAGILLADEAKGTVKKVDKGTVTVTVGDKDTDFSLKGAKVYDGDTEVTDKKERNKAVKGSEGKKVTITFTKDGDKVTVTEYKIAK
jgi:redox-regulated HSP33 family molecular chaperone